MYMLNFRLKKYIYPVGSVPTVIIPNETYVCVFFLFAQHCIFHLRILTLAEIFQTILYFANEFGLFSKFWLGPELKIGIQDPKDIEVSNINFDLFFLLIFHLNAF